MKNVRKVKKVTSYVLASLLAICLILMVLVATISSNIFNKKNIKKEFQESNYSSNLHEIIQNNERNYLLQSGFDESVFEGVVTENTVIIAVNEVINAIYDGNKVEVSTKELEETLDKNIQKQIEEKNYTVDDQAQADINEFKKVILDTYKDTILYSNDVMNQMSRYLKKAKKITTTATVVIAIIAIILAILTFKLRKSSLGIALLIAGAFLIMIKVYSGVHMVINNILILNWAFSRTVTYILNRIINQLSIVRNCYCYSRNCMDSCF